MTQIRTASAPLTLWRVTVERMIYVLAKDESEAETVARRGEREECGNSEPCLFATPAKDIKRVPEEWRDSIPYAPHGHKDEKTVAQILDPMSLSCLSSVKSAVKNP